MVNTRFLHADRRHDGTHFSGLTNQALAVETVRKLLNSRQLLQSIVEIIAHGCEILLRLTFVLIRIPIIHCFLCGFGYVTDMAEVVIKRITS